MFSTFAIACVNWLPATEETRVNRGTSRSTTAMLVSPEDTWMTPMASPGSEISSGTTCATSPNSPRTRANAVEIDLRELEPGSLDCGDGGAHHVALRRDEHDFHHVLVGRGHVVTEDVEVEDRFFNGDRDVVLRLVLDGAFELGLVHEGKIDEADDDLLVGDADSDVSSLETRTLPKLANRGGDGFGVDDLAFDDCAEWHVDQTVCDERESGAGGPDLRGPYVTGTYVEAGQRCSG